jgi:hypothetical protein
MRNIFSALLVLVLTTSLALAGWNQRQRDDGTAEWIDGSGDAYRIGQQILTVNLENLGTASTTYVPVPFAGRVYQVDLAVHGDVTTTTEALTVSIISATTSRGFIDITTNNSIEVASVIQNSSGFYDLGGAGQRYTSGRMAGKSTDNVFLPSGAAEETDSSQGPSVHEGGTIAIATGGASGADVDATIIIYYIPD